MQIVGELINSSRKGVQSAVAARDVAFIQDLARRQVAAGATMLDINAGTFLEAEPEALEWLVRVVQEAVDLPLCLDSPNPVALERALRTHRGKALLNSITAEEERLSSLIPLVIESQCSVVGLLMDDGGIPQTLEDRLRIAHRLVSRLTAAGVPAGDIFLDPLVQPVGVSGAYGPVVLETIRRVVSELAPVHTICGLSNVSFGLPARKLLNRAFVVMGVMSGLDTVILDPEDQQLMGLLAAARVVSDRDDFALEYISAFRAGRLAE
ncbi:MAG TPA: methyltetrahydrofolate cobalamin methyltransferase [Bacillota bacterium]|jgi:5-methyltetrahydrofolate--homocysteine methyltransferase